MHEVSLLLGLRHNYVVKLYETFETTRHILLVMELCAGGDLLNFVRKRKKLSDALIQHTFTNRDKHFGNSLKVHKALLTAAYKVRHFGTTALEMCYVACGRADGYVWKKAKVWDIAAASLIVEGANGKVTTFENSSINYEQDTTSIIATNTFIHQPLRNII